MNGIPSKLLSKMGVYDIQINGSVEVKARIRQPNQYILLDEGISELKSRMDNIPVVGIDFKLSKTEGKPDLLLLLVKNRCLIIQLNHNNNNTLHANLKNFLNDERICFVGFKINGKYGLLKEHHNKNPFFDFTGTGAEVGELAASVLKNPSLQECVSVAQLAIQSGLVATKDVDLTARCIDWGAKFFSEEEIKYAIHDVYHCYHIGKKLLSML